ncbi:asparagine synthase [Colletotrichum graminicola]|uniref:Asparagine synthase n=1 Tax=Colletotrichum graminicola (strain M1.001 / M2 / FGSC 10212) TaxID=645133 RepID=E3QYX4_COLGM|nr:asparagine synthase [Colletotrichum graminicola M1.001]EFQ36062.1 asparagine synthase [Colletotrichum graminicola M1.001]WDK14754.1 asparagine synthase [Colletotrichum graminicola]
MCGITAIVKLRRGGRPNAANEQPCLHVEEPSNPQNRIDLHNKLAESLSKIAHRGPDAEGIWISDDGSIGLGHRRLAINDLTSHGVQPIHSDDGKIHAVVNGEIYDHDAIRQRCVRDQGYEFKGHSDSEVLVALYKIYGAPEFFRHLRGEFSFIIFDENDGRVIVARDRFGIKPMFWTIIGNGEDEEKRLLLTSEVKAFLPLGWKPQWNVEGLISGASLQAENTVFRDVWKLNPGTWMEISQDDEIKHRQYWDPQYKDKRQVETRTVDEMIQEVRRRLVEAVRIRLRADVPVGIYLSGGIDSSVVAGIVTKLVREEGVKLGNQDATKRICCFSIQFPEGSGFNESDIAERTATWLGVQILKKDMNEEELAKNFADSVYHLEHHHFDLNLVGKFCLSTLPRQNGIPVVLTGEGADELFAGYPFLFQDFLLESDYAWPNSPLSNNDSMRQSMQKEVAEDIKNMFNTVGMFDHRWDKTAPSSPHIDIAQNALKWQPDWSLYAPWVRETYGEPDMREVVARTMSSEVHNNIKEKWHPLHSSLYIYTRGTLANMILTSLGDRTEMAHSIEARTPFLDHHLVEYVNYLPPSLKVGFNEAEGQAEGTGSSMWWKDLSSARQALIEKWILKEAGRPFITQEIYERRKHIYSAPVKWPYGGPLHLLFMNLVTETSVNNLGFVDWTDAKVWLERAFGDNADSNAFRKLVVTGSWVVLSQKFGVEKAVRGQVSKCF